MKALRIIFMGTPDFAVPALQALCEQGHEVIAVYSQPPRPKGRGQAVMPSPVQAEAQKRGIPVYHPVSLKGADEQQKFSDLKADVAVVAAYGLLLPKAILDAPKFGCINIHASLLPRWRGASPVQQAILAGDEKSGVTLMQMDAGLDTGPMIMRREVDITPNMTAQMLHDALSVLGGQMIVSAMERLAGDGKLDSEKQDETKVTYAPLLKKEDGIINWNDDAKKIELQVRALNPWPGVWTNFEGRRVKILRAVAGKKESKESAGTLIDRDGYVMCANGSALQILELQPENARAMEIAAAFNGGYLKVGGRFS